MSISATFKENVTVRIKASVIRIFQSLSFTIILPPLSIESYAHVVQQLQSQIVNQQPLQAQADEIYKRLKNKSTYSDKLNKHKAERYDGKSHATKWTTHMNSYSEDASDCNCLPLAVSYCTGAGHDWWILFKESYNDRLVQTWKDLKNALVSRFHTLNKENAQGMHASCR